MSAESRHATKLNTYYGITSLKSNHIGDRHYRDLVVVGLELHMQYVPIIANVVISNSVQARWTRYTIM